MDEVIRVTIDKEKTKLDPRTKLFLLILVSVLAMTGSIEGRAIYPRLIILLLPCALIAFEKKWKKALFWSLFLLVAWSVESFLLNSLTGLASLFLMIVTSLCTRFIPAMLMGSYFLQTTQVGELILALQKMKVSMNLIIPLAVMFRFFPTIVEEGSSINDAMRMRGITLKYAFKKPIVFLEYRFVPLMSSVVKIGDELSASALTRGLGGPTRRSSISTIGFHMRDILLIAINGLIAISYLIA